MANTQSTQLLRQILSMLKGIRTDLQDLNAKIAQTYRQSEKSSPNDQNTNTPDKTPSLPIRKLFPRLAAIQDTPELPSTTPNKDTGQDEVSNSDDDYNRNLFYTNIETEDESQTEADITNETDLHALSHNNDKPDDRVCYRWLTIQCDLGNKSQNYLKATAKCTQASKLLVAHTPIFGDKNKLSHLLLGHNNRAAVFEKAASDYFERTGIGDIAIPTEQLKIQMLLATYHQLAHHPKRAKILHQSGNRRGTALKKYTPNSRDTNEQTHQYHHIYLLDLYPHATSNEVIHDIPCTFKGEPRTRSMDISVRDHVVWSSTGNTNECEQPESNIRGHKLWRTVTANLFTLLSWSRMNIASMNNYGQHCREHVHCATKGIHRKMILFKTVPKNGSIFFAIRHAIRVRTISSRPFARPFTPHARAVFWTT